MSRTTTMAAEAASLATVVDGQRRARRRMRVPSVVALMVLLGGTVAASLVTRTLVGDQEHRLLKERASEVSLLFTSSASSTQSSLLALGQGIHLAKSGFSDLAGPMLAANPSIMAVAELHPGPGGFVVSATAGRLFSVGQTLSGPRATTMQEALTTGVLLNTPVLFDGKVRSIGGALHPPGTPAGTVLYREILLGPISQSATSKAAPFSELNGRLYAGDRVDPAQMILDTSGGHPLALPVVQQHFKIGGSPWLVAVAAKSPLVGPFAAKAQWLILLVGLLGSLLIVFVIEVVVRRRDYALALVDERTAALQTSLTDLQSTRDHLALALVEANEASRLKSAFLANMSHEIRTPMNGVMGMISLLLETDLDDRQQDYAQTMADSAESLLAIISDVLDFSKIEAGKLEVDEHAFALRPSVESTLDPLVPRAHQKGLELITVISRDVPDVVVGDRLRLRQVLSNLVANAIKFTDAGDVVLRVNPAAGGGVRFEIADTGIGISREGRDQLFEAFVQADPSASRRYGGTGLGLAICKQLVGLMGGQIGVDSAAGAGSVFWFTLPLAPAEPGAVEAQTAESDAPPAGDPLNRLTGMRALVVTHHPAQREALVSILAGWQMQTEYAPDPERALAALQEAAALGAPFELIVADWGPGQLDLAGAVKNAPALRSTRIVGLRPAGVVASVGDDHWVAGWVTKPVRHSALYDCLITLFAEVDPPRTALAWPNLAAPPRPAFVPPAPAAPVAPAEPVARLGRILVVEDNAVNQKVAVALLDRLGYYADVAPDGIAALRALDAGRYDAVLMDCQMPGMDGYEATAEIRRRETTDHIPIVAMTASAMASDREYCLTVGMDDYLAKPIDRELLAEALRRCLAGRYSSPSDSGVDPIDPDRLAQLRALDWNGELLTQVAELFRTSVAAGMPKLRDALMNEDMAAAARLAHEFRGASTNLGLRELARQYGAIEEGARHARIADPKSVLAEIDRELDRAMGRLESVLAAETPRPEESIAEPRVFNGPVSESILLVEDSEAQALMVTALVEAQPWPYVIRHVSTLRDAHRTLSEQSFDCVLLDLGLPDGDGLESLAQIRSVAPTLPIVVLTSRSEASLALAALRQGAQDYLVKGAIDALSLARSIRYAIERTVVEANHARQALHDGLTGLPNRSLLLDRLSLALARGLRRDVSSAVLFLDLDNFKSINDSTSHAAGDLLLRGVAERLVACVRPEDTVARFGGDEFAILLDGAETDEALVVADRIVVALSRPFQLIDREVYVRASVGIAVGRGGTETAEELVANADVAMYAAKAKGKDRHEVFDPEMRVHAVERSNLRSELEWALQRDELAVFYQPIISLITGQMVGAEALLRWRHPRRGLLHPPEFITLAEESGLILSIGSWTLRQACHQAQTWHDTFRGAADLSVSVNLSARQLQHHGLVGDVAAALRESGLNPSHLTLEITENAMVEDTEATILRLRALKQLGVRLSIDDFGTGYSSLTYLRRFPVDVLKVDRSFVSPLANSGPDAAIVGSITSLAHALGLEVVAEGVETAEQLRLVTGLGCDLAQGYHWSRPVEPGRLAERLSLPAVQPSTFPARVRPSTS